MPRILSAVALAVAFASLVPSVVAAPPRRVRTPRQTIQVEVNGQRVRFDRVRPLNLGRRVVVPLRGVFEKMGANVSYDGVNHEVFARKGKTKVRFRIGSRTAYVNGQPRRLDARSFVSKGHVLVPIRFIAETLDATVGYYANRHLVRVTSH